MASALTMLVATSASAASAPTTPTNVHPVFAANGVLTSIAWDASVSDVHVSYIVYNNSATGPHQLTQTSKTSRTIREFVLVDCINKGVTLHLSIQALASDAEHTTSGFSEQLEVTIPKVVPPRG